MLCRRAVSNVVGNFGKCKKGAHWLRESFSDMLSGDPEKVTSF